VALIFSALIAVIYAALSGLKPHLDITYDLGFFRCVAGFFTGVLAARLHAVQAFQSSPMRANIIEAFLLIGGVWFVVTTSGKGQFLVAPVLFLFVYVFAGDKGFVSRFMSHRIFRYLAKISYSVYMVHVIISIFFGVFAERILDGVMPDWNATGWGGDLLLIPYLAAVIIASHITYHLVEVPGGRLIRNWFKRREAKPKALKGEA